MKKKILAITIILALIFLPAKVMAVAIVYGTFTGFSGPNQTLEYNCIRDAIKEWQALFMRTLDHVITIDFVCDPNLQGASGEAVLLGWDQGYPTHVRITINNDNLNWVDPSQPPVGIDALSVLKHEVGHAIGIYDTPELLWGQNYSKLSSYWQPDKYLVEGVEVTDWGHTNYRNPETGRLDQMFSSPIIHARPGPSKYDLNALLGMYGDYKPAPEPATVVSLLGLAAGIAARKRVRARRRA